MSEKTDNFNAANCPAAPAAPEISAAAPSANFVATPATTTPRKIAIIRLSALGDIIQSAIVVQFIKKHFPNSNLTWFCDEKFAQLPALCRGVERVVALPLKSRHFLASWRTLRALAGEFDAVIDLQGLLKSALVAWALRARGGACGFDAASAKEWAAAWFYAQKTRVPYNENIILRNLTLAGEALGFGFSQDEILEKKAIFAADFGENRGGFGGDFVENRGGFGADFGTDFGENRGKNADEIPATSAPNSNLPHAESAPAAAAPTTTAPTPAATITSAALSQTRGGVLVAPFSSQPSKNYPHFAAVIDALAAAFERGECAARDIWLVAGSAVERAEAEALAAKTAARLLPPLSLAELVAAVSAARLVIGNDSGVTHLAWAQNVASVTIFGNRPSARNAYATAQNRVLDAGKKIDARRIDERDFCIGQIPPRRVASEVLSLLRGE